MVKIIPRVASKLFSAFHITVWEYRKQYTLFGDLHNRRPLVAEGPRIISTGIFESYREIDRSKPEGRA